MSIDEEFVIILAKKFGYLEKRVSYLEGKCRGQQGLIEELHEKLKNGENVAESQDKQIEGQVEESEDLKHNLDVDVDSFQISNGNLEGTFEAATKNDKKLKQNLTVQMGVRCEKNPRILNSYRAKAKISPPRQSKTENTQKDAKIVEFLSKSKKSRKNSKICSVCSKSFPSFSTLSAHMRVHTGERPFKCKICSKSFNHVGNLKIHSRVHTGEKPYSCSICSKNFTQVQHRNRHMITHTGEKSFSCGFCSKKFAQIRNRDEHIRTHTGEKPFSCSVCSKTFAQSSSLSHHKKKMHNGI